MTQCYFGFYSMRGPRIVWSWHAQMSRVRRGEPNTEAGAQAPHVRKGEPNTEAGAQAPHVRKGEPNTKTRAQVPRVC